MKELTKYQLDKKARGLCVHPRCSGLIPKIKKKHRGNYCYSCLTRNRRDSDPGSYYYYKKKANARAKGHAFTISLEYFRKWCNETGYLEFKGRFKHMASIDRDDPTKGYEEGNLKMRTVGENSRKRWVDYWSRQSEVPPDYNPPPIQEMIVNRTRLTEERPPW